MASVSEFIQEIEVARQDNLSIAHRNFLRHFIKQHKALFGKLGLDASIADEYAPSRFRILEVMANIFYHQALFDAFLLYLNEPARHVYQSVIWEGKQRIDTLEKRFSVKINAGKETIQDVQEAVLPEYLLLIIYAHHYYDFHQGKYIYSNLELGLTATIRNHLKKIAELPEKALLQAVAVLPPQEFVYENTPAFLDEFAAVRTYLEQHTGERISMGVVNKVRQYFAIQEFYPDTIKHLTGLRTRLLLQFVESCLKKNKPAELHLQIKTLLDGYGKGQYSNLQYLLMHLQGNKALIEEDTSVNSILLSVLPALPQMQWIAVSNLITHIRYAKPEILPVKKYTAQTAIHIDMQGKVEKEQLPIQEELYFPVISEPLIKASFFLYAALGLVDIAYTQPQNELAASFGLPYFSVFDGLQHVRLTPFGAYISGLHPTYQAPASKRKEAACILDENSLEITLSEADKLKALLLEKFAIHTTDTCFKVDYESFLKDCTTKRQIVKKIESFRKEIKQDPPQVWEDFFKNLLSRYSSIQQKKDFSIYKLPSNDKELLSLVAKDKILRAIVYKSENYHIMVNKLDIPVFQERLKKFGYLWE